MVASSLDDKSLPIKFKRLMFFSIYPFLGFPSTVGGGNLLRVVTTCRLDV